MYDKTVRRRRAVLGLLVGCSLILLTAYFGEPAGGALHSVQRGILEVVSPIQEGASRALKPIRDLFGWVGDTVSAKGDLKDARKERDMWRATAIRNEAAAREADKLRGLVGLDRAPKSLAPYGPVTARVIGRSSTVWYGRIFIDKGSSSGIKRNYAVLGSDGDAQDGAGLIGRVESVTANAATVRLITDASMSVPARTVKTDASGDVKPKAGNPRDLILDYTNKNDPIGVGDPVVTAGTTSQRSDLTSVYPPDLPIGRVTRIDEPGSEDQEVHLAPFVDLQRVEFVQVLTKTVDGNR
ncbi:MAG TPA: rod shape-determining protein MreC [Baekduia sp.]|nr:rod shape-determining protein MreC [Baekduia sp.]